MRPNRKASSLRAKRWFSQARRVVCAPVSPPPSSENDAPTSPVLWPHLPLGLGLSAIPQLARLAPSKLILAVRSPTKAEPIVVKNRQAFPSVTFDVWTLDLLSLESVKGFAKRCEGLERLDCFINNAGWVHCDPCSRLWVPRAG